jgi:hypothetical protein
LAGNLGYPGSPYQLLPYPSADRPAKLPPGHGGLALRAWVARRDEREFLAPIVGVDGEPAMYGWGAALVALPAGEHLVEVQYVEPVRAALVTVVAGEVTTFEHSPSQAWGPPRRDATRRRRPRRSGGYLLLPTGIGIVAGLLVFVVGLSVRISIGGNGRPGAAEALLGLLAVAVAAAVPLAVRARRGRADRRRGAGRRR